MSFRVLRVLRGLFWLLRKKSLGEIFFKMLLRKKYCGFAVYLQTKSLTIFFSVSSVCSVDFLGLALRLRSRLRLYSIVLNFEKCMTEIKIIS